MISEQLRKKIINFRKERNWEQFQSIKDLCIGLNVEVAELQELFLWKTPEQIRDLKLNNKDVINDEIADVFIFLCYLCNDLDINLSEAVANKIVKNNLKYPVEKARNSNLKYNQY